MKRAKKTMKNTLYRAAAFSLALFLLCGMFPAVSFSAQAAWTDPYLQKLTDWDVMRGDVDGNLDPNRSITRAEFITMINRAFGYSGSVTHPFTDVSTADWYSEDIGIAYNVGYFQGTSEKTAAPNEPLTREQAVVLLARNLMLEASQGETLGFSDSRDFSEWSRSYVEAATKIGIINGYPDGTFHPDGSMTRGEMAAVLSRAIGTLVNEPGEHSLGSVYGNVMINSSGIILRNTVIAGDLYLTGGIDLGDVLLENVTVLGKIIASGAGESQKGDSSIILRNVKADSMLVDSIRNQFVTIRAEGDTDVTHTSVRTSAYLEDRTPTGFGLELIEVDGETGIGVQLSGNIKEAVNLTPNSTLTIAQGTASKVTIDEKAVNSSVVVDVNGTVDLLNLDVKTKVTGSGDISHLEVSAADSSVSMLPDSVTVRPGISADIYGEKMDSKTAAESSADPRFLAGYPVARNVAPESADIVFSTNKKGTVYWALTSLSDGSVGETELLSPAAYSNKIIQSGTLAIGSSSTETTVQLKKLNMDGSYYLSAILVDNRQQYSPVKVTAFTTPDSSVPAFAKGYPTMSKITRDSALVTVMSTKSCQLYYAVLPKGSTAPTVQDLKAGSVSGNKGFGIRDMTKNVIDVFQVNGVSLQELESYDLYLCLIDADGGKNSPVSKITFTTVDGTPPVFLTEPTPTAIKPTSVGLTAALNEKGTIYWVAVQQGQQYPLPLAGQSEPPTLDSEAAKMQVANGMGNVVKSGKLTAAANRDVTINVTGLTAQHAYDLYYVAQDDAGNYSETVKMVTINTEDNQPPTARQTFSKTSDAEGTSPMADTNVRVIFSEGVQDIGGDLFLTLYNTSQNASLSESERKAAADKLQRLLRQDIQLRDADIIDPEKNQVTERTSDDQVITGPWIDYRYVTVSMSEGETVFFFENEKAIHLSSGGTYYFSISNIADTSNNRNVIRPNPQNLPEFTTVFAQIRLTDGVTGSPDDARVDMGFTMHPMSTQSVAGGTFFDVFLWSNTIMKFKLYGRVLDQDGDKITSGSAVDLFNPATATTRALRTPDSNGWYELGELELLPPADGSKAEGGSMTQLVYKGTPQASNAPFTLLNSLNEEYTYEFAIEVTQVEELSDSTTWSQNVTVNVTLPAGAANNIRNLSNNITEDNWNSYLNRGLSSGGVVDVSHPGDFVGVSTPGGFKIEHQFTDYNVPEFMSPYPTFHAGDSVVTMSLQLNRPGTVYYALAPVYPLDSTTPPDPDQDPDAPSASSEYGFALPTLDSTKNPVTPDKVPESGSDKTVTTPPTLSAPTSQSIYAPKFSSPRIKTGRKALGTGVDEIRVENLESQTTYYAYFVLKGASASLSRVYVYQFTTTDVTKPAILLTNESPVVVFETTETSQLYYALYAYAGIPPLLRETFDSSNYATEDFPDDKMTVADKGQDGNESTFSVLDALLTTAPGSQYSIFDQYARTFEEDRSNIRERVANFINGTTSVGGTNSPTFGSFNRLEKGKEERKDFEKDMDPGTQYFCLAVAHNVDGTVDSFKALKNVQIPDRIPPEFISVNTIATESIVDGKKVYSGSVLIGFTKPVYFLNTTGDIVARPLLFDKTGKLDDGYYDIDEKNPDLGTEYRAYFHNHVTSTFQFTSSKTTTAALDTFQLDFKNIPIGSTIVIFNDGDFSSSGSVGAKRKLTLTLKEDPMQSETQLEKPVLDVKVGHPAFAFTWTKTN